MGECYLMNVIRCEWLIHHQDEKIQPECECECVDECERMNGNEWMGMGEFEWVKVNGWMKMGECELWMGE